MKVFLGWRAHPQAKPWGWVVWEEVRQEFHYRFKLIAS